MFTYPLDNTGSLASNLITRPTGELHFPIVISSSDYKILIPDHAPFYEEEFELEYELNGSWHPMVIQTDYEMISFFQLGSRVCGKRLFGVIKLKKEVDKYRIKKYRTIGGVFADESERVKTRLLVSPIPPHKYYWDYLSRVSKKSLRDLPITPITSIFSSVFKSTLLSKFVKVFRAP